MVVHDFQPRCVSARVGSSDDLAGPGRAAAETAVYATDGYGRSGRNLAQSSLARDIVFRDGWSLQMASLSGSVADGYVATLAVPV